MNSPAWIQKWIHTYEFVWILTYDFTIFFNRLREPSRNLLCATSYVVCIRALSSARAFAAATCSARTRARSRRSLNIFLGTQTMSPPVALISFTSYGTDQKTQESELNRSRNRDFLNLGQLWAWLVPRLIPKHNGRFRVFRRTICRSQWSINIYETFGRKKIVVSLCYVVSAPCSETGPNLITKLCTEVNISIVKQNKLTLWIWGGEISGNAISTIGKWKFTILQNEMLSYAYKDHFV